MIPSILFAVELSPYRTRFSRRHGVDVDIKSDYNVFGRSALSTVSLTTRVSFSYCASIHRNHAFGLDAGARKKGRLEMRQNSLSKSLDTAGAEVKHDECIKRILSELAILAWILKGCVDEFKDVPISQIEKECIVGKPQISMLPSTRMTSTRTRRPLAVVESKV